MTNEEAVAKYWTLKTYEEKKVFLKSLSNVQMGTLPNNLCEDFFGLIPKEYSAPECKVHTTTVSSLPNDNLVKDSYYNQYE